VPRERRTARTQDGLGVRPLARVAAQRIGDVQVVVTRREERRF